MTTPPPAVPARVVEALNRYTAMCREVGSLQLGLDNGLNERFEAAHAALIAAIADAIEAEREACAVIAEQTAVAKPLHSTREARRPPKTASLSRITIAAAIRGRSAP
jgi:hypothetical protein